MESASSLVVSKKDAIKCHANYQQYKQPYYQQSHQYKQLEQKKGTSLINSRIGGLEVLRHTKKTVK